MKTIPIVNSSQVALVDDEDYDKLMKLGPWYLNDGYAKRKTVEGSTEAMHFYVLPILDGKTFDHRNRIRLDNQKENIRKCSKSQNAANAGVSSKNTSGYKGVTWHAKNKKWQAQIRVLYRRIYLGLFLSKEDAARAYNKAALIHFGEFAYQNVTI